MKTILQNEVDDAIKYVENLGYKLPEDIHPSYINDLLALASKLKECDTCKRYHDSGLDDAILNRCSTSGFVPRPESEGNIIRLVYSPCQIWTRRRTRLTQAAQPTDGLVRKGKTKL